MWQTGLQRVTAVGQTVRFRFRGTPNYHQWDYVPLQRADRPAAHLVAATAPRRSPPATTTT